MITPARALAIGAAALRHPRASRAAIEDFQSRALVRLVAHAYAHVPYYRALCDRHGVHPRDIRSIADLPKLPLVTKSSLQASPAEQVIADNIPADSLFSGATGGTTGEPLRVRRTWLEQAVQHAFRLRAEWQLGLRPGDLVARIGFRGYEGRDRRDRKLFGRALAASRIYRTKEIHTYPPARMLEPLLACEPDAVYGNAHAIVEIGRILSPEQKARLRPRFLISTAEVLTPAMRAEAEAAWGAPIWDYYGSNEVGVMAAQCPEAGDLHVCDDSVIVEIMRDGKPAPEGGRGEVVVTSLHHHAMPFIRYRHTDVAVRGPATCACGLPFSKIGALEGRMIDYFRFPGSRWVFPYDIVAGVSGGDIAWLQRFQLVQEREDRIVARLVPRRGTPPERIAGFERSGAEIVGPGVEFVVEVLERIDPEPNGKFRPARSLVRSEYDAVDWESTGNSQATDAARARPMPEHP